MEKFTPLAKIYTAAGSGGMDKFHLCNACCLTKDNVRVKIRAKSLVTNPPTGLSATQLIVYYM